ncbi:ParB/RepB/Spo0J family partition protein [Pseudomonas syringae]|uniref:ParB/RepB/Spo0J family partition protein n=1 Tax=Pseudomonas syringae TaxID=317 RepID=UPI0004039B25|nr:ParB/RepB/Spo0J family partition protein [Pseudomonas syringae]
MFFFHMLPSWDSIRRQLDRDIAPYRGGHFRTHRNEPVPSPALIMRRFNCVRSAFDRAEWEACRILGQRFVDLDISSIIKDLIDVVTQMAMIVVGSAFVGGAAGAGAGVLFFGVGAVPGGLIGAALGAQASAFILGILGLEAIAESVIDGFPRIIEYYTRGITTAWQGPREQGRNPFMGDDLAAQNSAVQEIAQGHVEVVILLLGAIVQYITRGRGNARALANEMRASAKGERLGQWMLEHEDELKKRPDLQRPEPRRGALDTQEPQVPPPSNTPKTEIVEDLDPKVIQEDPRNLISTQTKSEMSGSQIKRIAKDMEKNGFDPNKPVDVWRNSRGRLEIQDGHHRTEAAKKAGLDKIPVRIWE